MALFAADAGGRGAASTAARAQQNRGDQVPAEEAREDGDPRAGVRDPRDAEPRPEVADPGAGDAEAQAGGHAEPAHPDVPEAERRQRDLLPAVRRADPAAQLPGQLRPAGGTATAAAAAASSQSATELRHRVPSGQSRRIRGRLLSAE